MREQAWNNASYRLDLELWLLLHFHCSWNQLLYDLGDFHDMPSNAFESKINQKYKKHHSRNDFNI